jgi:peptidyl-tRNA hydrolase
MNDIQHGDKLYIIVRNDLRPGQQMAQSLHAAFHFYHDHSQIAKNWIEASDFICSLQVPNEDELYYLIRRAELDEIPITIYRESDLDDTITAIALAPGERTRRLCMGLKLAMRDI